MAKKKNNLEMLRKLNGKSWIDILSYYWFNGYFNEVNSLSPLFHLATNYPFLNDWCAHELGHPDHDEVACALIYGFTPFNARKKDFLDQIWGHKYFYQYFDHEQKENIVDESMALLPVFFILAAYFLNFIEFDFKPIFIILISVFINL